MKFTVWKLTIFFAIQILRQINFDTTIVKIAAFFKSLDLISRKNLSGRIIIKFAHCVKKTNFQFENNLPRRSAVKIDEVEPWYY